MKQLNILLSFLLIGLSVSAQPLVNESDTLRGSLNENRDWFDIKRYVIDVTPNYESKSIVGVVSWKAIAVKPSKQIQIDLQTFTFCSSFSFDKKNDKQAKYLDIPASGPFKNDNYKY